ncbi:MFS transporter [Egibacter rhizosphaerae]|uniref:MFS transporter n=1 Tax=Egibacter rhizosphaerae TaxID=1670831 RepID=A0A411YK36_9ACTN|nr:MFS transporter [Egibacter rhizosphaerae]QBI21574.1 MFS transporter [Egibacter rhizosphaerae]
MAVIERVGVLAPLRHRDYRLLACAQLVSLAGDGFFRVAIGVQVLLVSNDAGAVAVVAIAWAGGLIASLPFGGWASDRFERRRVMIAADLWRAAMMGAIGWLSVTGQLELWQLLTLGALFGFGNGFFNPAATSLVPQLLPDADLPRANAFLGVARPGMIFILGPLLGGGVVAVTGAGMALLLDAVTFLVSAALLLRVRRQPAASEATGSMRETFRAIAAGLRFVARTNWAWPWLLGSSIGTLAFHGPFDVLLPYLLFNELAMAEGEVARTISLVLAAGGLGSVIVSTVIGQRDLPRRFVTVMYLCEAGAVASLAILGLMTATWHGIVAGALVFTLFAVSEIIWTTTMQRLVPSELLGRVSSVDWFANISLAPASFGVAWLFDELLGPRGGLIAAAAVGAGVLLVLLSVPGTRQPERMSRARGDAVSGPHSDEA